MKIRDFARKYNSQPAYIIKSLHEGGFFLAQDELYEINDVEYNYLENKMKSSLDDDFLFFESISLEDTQKNEELLFQNTIEKIIPDKGNQEELKNKENLQKTDNGDSNICREDLNKDIEKVENIIIKKVEKRIKKKGEEEDKKNKVHINEERKIEKVEEKKKNVEEEIIPRKRVNILGTIDIDSIKDFSLFKRKGKELKGKDTKKKKEEIKVIVNKIKEGIKTEINNINKEENDKNNKESEGGKEKKSINESKELNVFKNYPKIDKDKIKKFKILKKEKLKEKKKNAKVDDSLIEIESNISLEELSVMLNCDVNELLETCRSLNIPVSVHQTLDKNIATLLAEENGYTLVFKNDQEEKLASSLQDSNKERRDPIITIVGHVDHGKTTLVDYICKSYVAKMEQGGITQHISAYNIKIEDGRTFTLIDTPGHEIFTAMRARAIAIADIVVVVIAADSGIQPQTEEILRQLLLTPKAVIFAFNKIDKPEANINKIKEKLSTINFTVEDWGGKYQCQEISALKGTGIKDLLEKIFIEYELLDLMAVYKCPAKGVVLDSFFDKTNGYQNNILVQEGTLKKGDYIVTGELYGKVKNLKIDNKIVTEVIPAKTATVIGLSGCAIPGEDFFVVSNEKEAKEIANEHIRKMREQKATTQHKITFDMFKQEKLSGGKEKINIITNADANGSSQVLLELLSKFSNEKYQINIIRQNIGDILDSDVETAITTKAMMIGFNVKIGSSTAKYAEKNNIIIKHYNVIYEIADQMNELIKFYEDRNKELKCVGRAEVLKIFKIKTAGTIAGCVVREGIAHVSDTVKVVREGKEIFVGDIKSMKHGKVDVKEVKVDGECGVCINRFDNIKEGDVLEFLQKQ